MTIYLSEKHCHRCSQQMEISVEEIPDVIVIQCGCSSVEITGFLSRTQHAISRAKIGRYYSSYEDAVKAIAKAGSDPSRLQEVDQDEVHLAEVHVAPVAAPAAPPAPRPPAVEPNVMRPARSENGPAPRPVIKARPPTGDADLGAEPDNIPF